MQENEPGTTTSASDQAQLDEMTAHYRAGDPARDQAEQEYFRFLADLDTEAAEADARWEQERERQGAAAEAEAEQRFADYWGGTGPDYEAKAGHSDEPWPEAPWWDGERMHGADTTSPARQRREPEAEAG